MAPCKIYDIRVNDSIEQIERSWLIGRKVILTRQSVPAPDHLNPSWSDGEGGFFVVKDAPTPLHPTTPHPAESLIIPRVHAAGDCAAVWRAGEAFIKAHNFKVAGTTREHVPLQYVHGKKPVGFEVPRVLYHAEIDDRYFLITSRVPGVTLMEAWPSLDETLRD
ncbi:hypothetical protein QBC42DRAFT_285282 [Cladorrhinum samala]|uniref:Uncharacterized protein n=1 Tax=Cladorrhinum samala TaxID=585594 RepID=A0AAV9HV11_9PEZI|nr:hypothetical protein QBC42DRAFT_285282 [Cladorrhinum samala]